MNTTQNFASVFPEKQMYPTNIANGRIDLMTPVKQPGWAQQEQQQGANSSFNREALYGRIQRTPASDMFFSSQNIDIYKMLFGTRYTKMQTSSLGDKVIKNLKLL